VSDGRAGVTRDHYTGDGEMTAYDVVDSFGLDFYTGNAVRYILCARQRGDYLGDLRRARDYLDAKIARMEDAATARKAGAA